jgi:hypothetical protein
MFRAIRFAVWTFAVFGALAFQLLNWRWFTGICLVVIFALLCTTPPRAIRLPRWTSDGFILISTLLVHQPRTWTHLGLLLVLLILLRLWHKSAWWAVLYGWCPV